MDIVLEKHSSVSAYLARFNYIGKIDRGMSGDGKHRIRQDGRDFLLRIAKGEKYEPIEDSSQSWYDRYFAVMEPRLEAVREGRSSTIDLGLCEGGRKQYLKTVEMNQVMLEVTAMRAKHNR
jgi:hypothetical protein